LGKVRGKNFMEQGIFGKGNTKEALISKNLIKEEK